MQLKSVYSLLSLNILCGTFLDPLPIQRLRTQARRIQKLSPDIICLQEFNNPIIEYIYKNELGKNYDFHIHRVPQIEFARRFMICATGLIAIHTISPVMTSLYLGMFLNPYLSNFILGTQCTGNAILTHKTLQIDTQTHTKVKEFTYQNGDFLNWMRRRGYIELSFKGITIRNTHLNYGRSSPKFEQMNECMDNLPSPSLLVGDFNTDNVIPILIEGYKDISSCRGPTYRCDNKYTTGLKKDRCIDYIFSNSIPIESIQKLDLESDHDALFIQFKLEKQITNQWNTDGKKTPHTRH